ncbi:MAG: hypothetical protein PCFJNLEI_01962 [Verrucomicrobiae bacterium]|nr:hypothetical protein [Verrucomicrobiae bacterium]
MIGKRIFTGCVIAFWAVMMTALVRVEFFPRESRLVPVSTAQIMDKVFQNRIVTHLDVIYQNAKIGSVNNLEFIPLNDGTGETGAGQLTGYEVTGDVWLNLVIFGAPSRLRLRPVKLHFDTKYELTEFHLRTGFGESQAEINGDNTTKQLTVSYDFGEGRQSRQVGYADLGSGSALAALGVPGLQGMPGLGALGMLGGGSPAKTVQNLTARMQTRAYYDYLNIGGSDQRTFLINVQLDQGLGLWIKTWIDEQGNILKVETSLGLSLISSAINTEKLVDRTFERAPRKP